MTPRVGRRALARTAAVLLGAATLVSCDDGGPEGPGSWDGLVRSSTAPAGAVVLQIDGTGIQGVEGVGPVSAFADRTAGSGSGSGTWRVVLVTPTPGEISFRVLVDDRAAGAPRAVVMSAADGQNQPLSSIASFSVEIGVGP